MTTTQKKLINTMKDAGAGNHVAKTTRNAGNNAVLERSAKPLNKEGGCETINTSTLRHNLATTIVHNPLH